MIAKRKTYFVCDWNAFSGNEGKGEWIKDETETAWAIRAVLRETAPNWVETDTDESKAELIVVVPRDRDRRLSVLDLLVFATGLGSRRKTAKKVFYVHPEGRPAFAEGRVYDWLFCASTAACPARSLTDWLDESIRPFPQNSMPQILNTGIKQLRDVLDQAGLQLNGCEAGAAKYCRDHTVCFDIARLRIDLSRSGQQLLGEAVAEKSTAKFFYALCRLTKDYDRVEHDVNARGATRNGLLAGDSIYHQARLHFLDTCMDLRAATAARCLCRAAPNPGKRNRILLIDDNPERAGFVTDIERVMTYLPGYKLTVWNPDKELPADGRLRRRDLEHYSSMRASGIKAILVKKLTLREYGGEQDQVKPAVETLMDALLQTHVLLVDILFSDARGNDYEAGYGLMCGLQRLCRDAQPIMKSDTDKKWYVPDVLAISRASDIAKVHTVYRSGAAGYVLKNRPLSLPGAIANTFLPALESIDTAHRNFRLLYSLPHSTLGLLCATAIPKVSFHRPLPEEGDANRVRREKEFEHALPMAKLLAALPKADLHVHPSTCMTPEFLVVASLVMLTRHRLHGDKRKDPTKFKDAVKWLAGAFAGRKTVKLVEELVVRSPASTKRSSASTKRKIAFSGKPDKIRGVAQNVSDFLCGEIKDGENNRHQLDPDEEQEKHYLKLRSILHRALNFPDHQHSDQIFRDLKNISDFALFFFALQHCNRDGADVIDDADDLMRLYLLWLASDMNTYGDVVLSIGSEEDIDIRSWFREGDIDSDENGAWSELHRQFHGDGGLWGVESFRAHNWEIREQKDVPIPEVKIRLGKHRGWGDLLDNSLSAEEHPIAYLLATGMRSSNLREYLEGCEYTGAEHLQHPFLTHLFAEQTVYEFIRHGVLYAELRASLSGYENRQLKIAFSDACACFCTAMAQAQHMAQQRHGKPQNVKGWLWSDGFAINDLFDPVKDEMATYRFPCKTSVVLTGKRHKASRLLVREAGAGAMLHARPPKPATSAKEFAETAVPECRVVGFDLAGQEDEHHPQKFRAEYDQIARMHIPVTIHAGENAPVDFVESAILDLRARRLGHGLALADDRLLMERARDDGICIELCPVSNFQTNAVYSKDDSGQGREYPLRKFLKMGLNVTLNTDNPVVSHTNMVKECFQASYALGGTGLSVWELLRILRTGFTQSFLTQPERRALLELADQIVFDLFSRPEILDMLGVAAFQRPPSQALGPPP